MKKLKKTCGSGITNQVRILLHVVFWVLSYFILLQVFSLGKTPVQVDFLYDFLFHLFLLAAVYVNLYVLLPGVKRMTGWIFYGFQMLLLVSIITWLNLKFFNEWSAVIFPDFYFISYYSAKEVAQTILEYLIITTLLKFSKSWFTVNELQRRLLEAEKEKVQLELTSLKAQVNPHFFFNTLNGLYAMSFKNNPVLATSILQLSDLMRYFIYDATAETVPLEKEINMLQDYTSLMKMRADEGADIDFEIKGDPSGKHISPLLFISFLENAFKHGVKGARENTFIHTLIEIETARISFKISNNKGQADEPGFKIKGGSGLENVKRRLELLYPLKHLLTIKEDENKFEVDLQLITV